MRPNAEKPKAQYDEHVQIHLPDATDPLPAKDTGVGGVNYTSTVQCYKFSLR